MSLYHKYRPETFAQIVGNKQTVSILEKSVKENKSHAYLLIGPTGCGKTTLARIIAQEVHCSNDDLKEINTSDQRGIDTIREIIRQSHYRPMKGDSRVWIIDECHKMTNDAQNAMLKILEEPPKHVYFILCTTEPNKLINTIKGRCSQFQVNTLNDDDMFRLLRKIVKKENEHLDEKVFDQIIMDSLGHPRNALQILDQVLSADEDTRLQVAERTAEKLSQSIELCRALIGKSSWKLVSKILEGLKDEEAESIRRHVLGYARSVLLNKDEVRAARIIEEFWEPLYDIGFPGLVYACYSVIKN